MTAKFFRTQLDFRKWLDENHTKASEILIGFYSVKSGKTGMSYSESVEQALCYGWIDGVRRSIDAHTYCNRFTPRKLRSNWSAVNIAKVAKLIENGSMQPAGLVAFEKRDPLSGLEDFPSEYEAVFKANKKAWLFFENQASWYKKQRINWAVSAKQEVTRQSRLEKLIEASKNGTKLL